MGEALAVASDRNMVAYYLEAFQILVAEGKRAAVAAGLPKRVLVHMRQRGIITIRGPRDPSGRAVQFHWCPGWPDRARDHGFP